MSAIFSKYWVVFLIIYLKTLPITKIITEEIFPMNKPNK